MHGGPYMRGPAASAGVKGSFYGQENIVIHGFRGFYTDETHNYFKNQYFNRILAHTYTTDANFSITTSNKVDFTALI